MRAEPTAIEGHAATVAAAAAADAARRPPQRLPRLLAYRLSKLSARAHAFHRFAHHPLCAAYAPEILRLGRRTHVCAGCTWTAAGSALGLVLGAASPQAWATLWGALGAQVFGLACLGALVHRHARAHKWLLRAGPMLPLGWGMVQALRYLALRPINAWMLAAESALALAGWVALGMYRHRSPWREPCTTCPQRQDAVCDGWRRPVQRERALHRLSGLLIERHTEAGAARRMGCNKTAVDFAPNAHP